MEMTEIVCSWCGDKSLKYKKEIDRRIKKGATNFFCSLSCTAKFRNTTRSSIVKTCPTCKNEFETMTGAKSPTFCSRSCASKGSVTEKRRKAQSESGKKYSKNLIPSFESLRLREMWKYVELKKLLDFQKINYEFEHVIDCHIFDLVIFDKMLLIEFDGPYHNLERQRKVDKKKDEFAKAKNYSIIRIKVPQNSVIESEVLYSVL